MDLIVVYFKHRERFSTVINSELCSYCTVSAQSYCDMYQLASLASIYRTFICDICLIAFHAYAIVSLMTVGTASKDFMRISQLRVQRHLMECVMNGNWEEVWRCLQVYYHAKACQHIYDENPRWCEIWQVCTAPQVDRPHFVDCGVDIAVEYKVYLFL